MEKYPKVAIIYLSYYSTPYIADAIEALTKINYPKEQLEFIIVDNPHPEYGLSKDYIEHHVLPRSTKDLPHVTYLPQIENLGFCGGNNVGLQWAIDNNFDYAYLHNQDGFMERDCVEKLVQALEQDSKIGCAQSVVALHPDTELINSTGNSYHYLGFGHIRNFGKKLFEHRLSSIETTGYATGASLIMRVPLLKQYGLLEEDFFAYHEDIEYSLRLKLVGYSIAVVHQALFFHKYVFSRSRSKFYYMERNRYALLIMYYKWKTLFVMLPMLLIMEIGLTYFFIRNGWFKEKLKLYGYWLRPKNWAVWLAKRKKIQKLRTVTDRSLLADTVTDVVFGEKDDMNSPLLIYLANPLLRGYGWFLKKIIFW